MKKRDKRPQGKHDSAYPSLTEHLLNRRDMLAYVGASLLTGSALAGCFMTGDDDSGGAYYSARLPDQGSDVANLQGGGACTYFVNVMAYCEYVYHDLLNDMAEAQAICRAVLAQLDYATLAAARSGAEAEPLRQAEQQIATELRDQLACNNNYYEDITATITIVELVA